MIGGLFFLGSIVAIFTVLRWFIRNDGAGEGKGMLGLLAMKPSQGASDGRSRKKWSRKNAGPVARPSK